MNKQTVERLIKVSNWNDKLYTVIETKDNSYNCYGNIITGIEQLSFVDDYNKVIVLNIEDVIGIKVADIQNVIQCVTEGEKVKYSVAETVLLSHLLNTNTITNSYTTRIPYNNNTNTNINVIVITYSTYNTITIVTYLSATYDNNSIYFTILILADNAISDTYTYSNVLKLTY